MLTSRRRPVLAVDLGGTKILTAVILSTGEIVCHKYSLTLAGEGSRPVIDRLLSVVAETMVQAKLKLSDIVGIGIAVAGIIDVNEGVVTTSPNLPGWRNVSLRDIIAERFGLTTYLINDANAAALGEHRFGAGIGFDNMIYLTVSTGIGGGIIMDGKLYSGPDGCAGELGHMTIEADGPQCHCGNFGCLEALASGWAVAKAAITRINNGEESSIIELVGGRLENITAKTVAVAAKRGDQLAADIIAKAANYLGIGLANLVNIFNPQLIIIGGGLSKMGDMLLKPARKVLKERAFRLPVRTVHVVRARLDSNSSIIGAAAYVFDQKDETKK